MIERDVARALFRRVQSLSIISGPLQGITISWINNSFKLPTGAYLSAANMFNPPERQDVKGEYHILEGLLQVTLMLPENAGDPYRLATPIIEHFPADLIMLEGETQVRITRRPDLGPFLQGSPHWEQPVNIHWQAMLTEK